MKKMLLALVICSLLVGCATSQFISKPTIFTNPLSYLNKVPLNTTTKDELINELGIPDKTTESGGKTYLAYELGKDFGKREFVYIISNDIVIDVTYHDQGPFNGASAKKRQMKQ